MPHTNCNGGVWLLQIASMTWTKEKQRQYMKKYKVANSDRIKKNAKEYRLKTKEKMTVYLKRYFLENKEHIAEYKKKYASINAEKIKEKGKKHRLQNADALRVKRKEYSATHKKEACARAKKWVLENKEYATAWKKAYAQRNKKKLAARAKEYMVERKKTDIQFRLSCNLRNRLWMAIRHDYKSGSAVRDLGCTIAELKMYIEGQFKDGMSWENWTRVDLHERAWNIDHKIPLNFFNLTDREQFLKAVHYSNLQPMWARENISKGAKTLCK